MSELLAAVEQTRSSIEETHSRRIEKLDQIRALAEELEEIEPAETDGPVEETQPDPVPAPKPSGPPVPEGDLDREILRAVAEAFPGSLRKGEIAKRIPSDVSPEKLKRTLARLVDAGELETEGIRAGTRYGIKSRTKTASDDGTVEVSSGLAPKVKEALGAIGGPALPVDLMKRTGLDGLQVKGGLNALMTAGEAHEVRGDDGIRRYDLVRTVR